jgi:uncharacterized membrane protein
MQLDSHSLALPWLLLTACLAFPLYAFSLVRAPWKRWLIASPERQHLWLASLVVLMLIWSRREPAVDGLSVQFLLVTALTLMHGWRLAVVGVGAVLAAGCIQHGDWAAWPANLLCLGCAPVLFVHTLHRTVEYSLPRNYFIFVFVTVFAGSVIAFVLAALAPVALLQIAGSASAVHATHTYLSLLPMMSVAEATMNGLVMVAVIAYRPQWVATFDDRQYFAS